MPVRLGKILYVYLTKASLFVATLTVPHEQGQAGGPLEHHSLLDCWETRHRRHVFCGHTNKLAEVEFVGVSTENVPSVVCLPTDQEAVMLQGTPSLALLMRDSEGGHRRCGVTLISLQPAVGIVWLHTLTVDRLRLKDWEEKKACVGVEGAIFAEGILEKGKEMVWMEGLAVQRRQACSELCVEWRGRRKKRGVAG
ncbi:hypothetical protein ACOMHN_008094 [Nucella lapillus]